MKNGNILFKKHIHNYDGTICYYSTVDELNEAKATTDLLQDEAHGFNVTEIHVHRNGIIAQAAGIREWCAMYDGAEEHFTDFQDAVDWIDYQGYLKYLRTECYPKEELVKISAWRTKILDIKYVLMDTNGQNYIMSEHEGNILRLQPGQTLLSIEVKNLKFG